MRIFSFSQICCCHVLWRKMNNRIKKPYGPRDVNLLSVFLFSITIILVEEVIIYCMGEGEGGVGWEGGVGEVGGLNFCPKNIYLIFHKFPSPCHSIFYSPPLFSEALSDD